MRKVYALLLTGMAIAASAVQAQNPAPIRSLGAIVAKAPVTFDTIISVRALSDGRVLVNDLFGLRLTMLDASFTPTIIADTSATAPHKYGNQPSPLLNYTGDSSILIDFSSASMIVIEPSGKYGRVMAAPNAADLQYIAISTIFGSPGFDPSGRLVYRGAGGGLTSGPIRLGCTGAKTAPTVNGAGDTASIVRANFDTRTVDTIATVKFLIQRMEIVEMSAGCWNTRRKADVLPFHGDEWVLLKDGTLAIVREQDYHVDWIAPNGTRTSSPKMPFDWRKITDDEKQHMIDSVTHWQDSVVAHQTIPPGAPPGYKPTAPPTVSRAEIPDFYPPLKLGSVKVDLDGNLWIPPSTSRDAKGGTLYDVVNRKGEVFERVQLEGPKYVVGFVPGFVILASREGKRMVLEKAALK